MIYKNIYTMGFMFVLASLFVVGCGGSTTTNPSEGQTNITAEAEQESESPESEPPAAAEDNLAIDPLSIGDPERGQEIFLDRNYTKCEGCHSLDGSEFRGAPTMLGISERALERVPELSVVDYLRQSILEPTVYLVDGFENKMPAYQIVERPEGEIKVLGEITEQELNDLIAFMLTQ